MTRSNEESDRLIRDLEFMMNREDSWPRWPILPVVKRDGTLDCGILVASHGEKPRVFIVNIMDLHAGKLMEQLDGKTVVEYDSWGELVKDWRVD